MPEDSLTQARATLAPDVLESLAPYSPRILPGFDKEEFMNRPDEDEDALEPIPDPVVTPSTEASNLAEEVSGREDADRNSPS